MTTTNSRRLKVALGRVVITSAANQSLTQDDVLTALWRHARGDWGHLDDHDWQQNDRSLKSGGRLLSRFYAMDGRVFWVITEADRSVTTVLFPEDY